MQEHITGFSPIHTEAQSQLLIASFCVIFRCHGNSLLLQVSSQVERAHPRDSQVDGYLKQHSFSSSLQIQCTIIWSFEFQAGKKSTYCYIGHYILLPYSLLWNKTGKLQSIPQCTKFQNAFFVPWHFEFTPERTHKIQYCSFISIMVTIITSTSPVNITPCSYYGYRISVVAPVSLPPNNVWDYVHLDCDTV
jgi:hypothetical protein